MNIGMIKKKAGRFGIQTIHIGAPTTITPSIVKHSKYSLLDDAEPVVTSRGYRCDEQDETP